MHLTATKGGEMDKYYLVERTDQADWDEYDSFVVKAKDEKDALAMCNEEAGHGMCGDFTAKNTIIKPLDETMENGIILGSFNAG